MTRARDLADSADKDIAGTLTLDGLTVAGNVSVDGGTIKLDGNYPVSTNNVALGNAALDSLTSGGNNTAIGRDAMTANTSGGTNVALGGRSLEANTTASNNVAVGYGAILTNTTGENNVGIGYNALLSNTTASSNTAVGYQAAYSNTTGATNTALGQWSLYDNTSGSNNVALGRDALQNNTTASNNTAVGYQALYSNTGGSNVALGFQSAYNSTTATQNTYLGYYAGRNATTGSQNTFVGNVSGEDMTTGSKNTILGRYNGNQGGLDIRTSSNNIVLSDGDGVPRMRINSAGDLQFTTYVANGGAVGGQIKNGSNGRDILELDSDSTGSVGLIHFYNPNGFIAAITTSGTSVQYNTTSDYRLKENVVEIAGATDRLKQIPVYRFNFINDPTETVDGFLAHEVQAVVPEAVTGEKDAVGSDGTPRWQGIDQSKLVPLLVATIKELEARITALENA